MKVTFVNNAGGGVSQTLNTTSGKTVGAVFRENMNGASFGNYSVNILRGGSAIPAGESTVLQENDIVSVISNKTGANHTAP